jgi:hypothetical protein
VSIEHNLNEEFTYISRHIITISFIILIIWFYNLKSQKKNHLSWSTLQIEDIYKRGISVFLVKDQNVKKNSGGS